MRKSGGGALPIVYSDISLNELDEIALWNESTYNRAHAKRYLAFLEKHIVSLGRNHHRGKIVDFRPDVRYLLIQRTTKRHGHVAVYRVTEEALEVLHVFHTAQDWQSKLSDE